MSKSFPNGATFGRDEEISYGETLHGVNSAYCAELKRMGEGGRERERKMEYLIRKDFVRV